MKILQSELHDEINELFIEVFKKLDENKLNKAQSIAEKSQYLLLVPKYDWDVTISLVSDICDFYKELGFYEKSHKIVNEPLNSDHLDGYYDGPILLKGTIYFEQGELALAKVWFDKARTISKGRCFVSQPKKYNTFYNKK